MQKWEKFENDCVKYLKSLYKSHDFKLTGGHNSNNCDIEVKKDGRFLCSLECKMDSAQCGKFVLYVDKKKRKITFSARNKTLCNKYVEAIIKEMDTKFDECFSSSKKDLPISEKLIYQWVKDYYSNVKGTKFFITQSKYGNFIIIPIDRIDKYFSFTAKYRMKISGSSSPSESNLDEINDLLIKNELNAKLEYSNSMCYAKFSCNKEKFVLKGAKYRYQFTKSGCKYLIRRLSNTTNSNFIVSIKLKEENQKESDFLEFTELLK